MSESNHVMNTMGVLVTLDADSNVELFQCDEDSSSTITLSQDEARLLVMRLGRRFGMNVTQSEGEDDEG